MWDVIIRALTAVFMLGLPVGLVFYLRVKVHATWRLLGIGAATFASSQVIHIPLNVFIVLPMLNIAGLNMDSRGDALWFLAIALGLSAGVCEETARYLVYRYWLKSPRDRRFPVAVSLGGGHGACEAILVGLIAVFTLNSMIYLRHKDLNKILPPEQVPTVTKLLNLYWEASWDQVLMAAVERVTAMIFHLAASVLVLQTFVKSSYVWLIGAIGFHTLIDTVAVIAAVEEWDVRSAKVILAMLTIPMAVWILRAFSSFDGVMDGNEYVPILDTNIIDPEDNVHNDFGGIGNVEEQGSGQMQKKIPISMEFGQLHRFVGTTMSVTAQGPFLPDLSSEGNCNGASKEDDHDQLKVQQENDAEMEKVAANEDTKIFSDII